MRRLAFVLLLLTTPPAFAQSSVTIKELTEIYLGYKPAALKLIEAKGYKPASTDEARSLFGEPKDDQLVFSQSDNSSLVGIIFDDKDKVSMILYADSIRVVGSLLNELRDSELNLVNKHGDMSEAYTTKKLNYFFLYEVMDVKLSRAIVAIMPKSKNNKILYAPKR